MEIIISNIIILITGGLLISEKHRESRLFELLGCGTLLLIEGEAQAEELLALRGEMGWQCGGFLLLDLFAELAVGFAGGPEG